MNAVKMITIDRPVCTPCRRCGGVVEDLSIRHEDFHRIHVGTCCKFYTPPPPAQSDEVKDGVDYLYVAERT